MCNSCESNEVFRNLSGGQRLCKDCYIDVLVKVGRSRQKDRPQRAS